MTAISLHSGSAFIGNPITIKITPDAISEEGLSFHRVIINVVAALHFEDSSKTDTDYTIIKMSDDVKGKTESITDISSALRTVADKYEYSAEPTSFPNVKWRVEAYEEYMKNGVITTGDKAYFPGKNADDEIIYYYGLMGGFSDMERLKAASAGVATLRVKNLTRKPNTIAEVICKGESYVYPVALKDNTHPNGYLIPDVTDAIFAKSVKVTPATTGYHTYGDRKIYVRESHSEDRYQIRFVNGLGCLESINVNSYISEEVAFTTNNYSISTPESFSSFARRVARKSGNKPTLYLSSGPVDKLWQQWFLHELLMTDCAWILINGIWVRASVLPEETVAGINRKDKNMLEVAFKMELDINGSPSLTL